MVDIESQDEWNYRARDAIDLVAATIDAPAGVVEHAIFGEDLVDSRASARGVVFPEDVVKIAGQQRRYAYDMLS